MTNLFTDIADKHVCASDIAMTINNVFSKSVVEYSRFEDVLMEHDQEGGVDVEEGLEHIGSKVDSFSSVLLHDEEEDDIIGMMLIEHVAKDSDGFSHVVINTLLDHNKLSIACITEKEANKLLIEGFFDEFNDDIRGNSIMSHVNDEIVDVFQEFIFFPQLKG